MTSFNSSFPFPIKNLNTSILDYFLIGKVPAIQNTTTLKIIKSKFLNLSNKQILRLTASNLQELEAKKIFENAKKVNDEIFDCMNRANQLLGTLKKYLKAHHENLQLINVFILLLRENIELSLLSTNQNQARSDLLPFIQQFRIELTALLDDTSNSSTGRDRTRKKINCLLNICETLLKKYHCNISHFQMFKSALLPFLEEDCYPTLLVPLVVIYSNEARRGDKQQNFIQYFTRDQAQYCLSIKFPQLLYRIQSCIRDATENFDWLCQELSRFIENFQKDEIWQSFSPIAAIQFALSTYLKQQLTAVEDVQAWLDEKRPTYFSILQQLNKIDWTQPDQFIALEEKLSQMLDNLGASFGHLAGTSLNSSPELRPPLDHLHRCHQIGSLGLCENIRDLQAICKIFKTHKVAITKLLGDPKQKCVWEESFYKSEPLSHPAFIIACDPIGSFQEKKPKGSSTQATPKKKSKQKASSGKKPQEKEVKKKVVQSNKQTFSPELSVSTPHLLKEAKAAAPSIELDFNQLTQAFFTTILLEMPKSIRQPHTARNLCWHLNQLITLENSDFSRQLSPYSRLCLVSGTLAWAIEQAYTMELSNFDDASHHLVYLHQQTQQEEVPSIVQTLLYVNEWIRFWNQEHDRYSYLKDLYQEDVKIPPLLEKIFLAAREPQKLDASEIETLTAELLKQGKQHLTHLMQRHLSAEAYGQCLPTLPKPLENPILPLKATLQELNQWEAFIRRLTAEAPEKTDAHLPYKKIQQIQAMSTSLKELVTKLPEQKNTSEAILHASWIIHWLHEIAAEGFSVIIYERTGVKEYRRHLSKMAERCQLSSLKLVTSMEGIHNKVRYPASYESHSQAAHVIDYLHQVLIYPEVESGFSVQSDARIKTNGEKGVVAMKIAELDQIMAVALAEVRESILSKSYLVRSLTSED